jgi:hypothetical protein
MFGNVWERGLTCVPKKYTHSIVYGNVWERGLTCVPKKFENFIFLLKFNMACTF